jgi:hypothetical protein
LKVIALILLFGFSYVVLWVSEKLILDIKYSGLFWLMTISVEDADVFLAHIWDFRVIEASSFHLWLVERDTPENHRGSKDLS